MSDADLPVFSHIVNFFVADARSDRHSEELLPMLLKDLNRKLAHFCSRKETIHVDHISIDLEPGMPYPAYPH